MSGMMLPGVNAAGVAAASVHPDGAEHSGGARSVDPQAQASVLIVEDDEQLALVLCDIVREMGYSVQVARTGGLAVQMARKHAPSLVLLDLRLPDISGLSVLRELSVLRDTATVVITAVDDPNTVETALEMGAYDYVRKPFHINELRARVRSAMRRRAGESPRVLRAGRVHIDRDRCVAAIDGREVDLSATEFRLLAFLAEHPGWVFSKERLLSALWPDDRDVHVVQVHISKLRHKIEADPENPTLLVTVKGLGYRLQPFASPQPTPADQDCTLGKSD